MIVSCVVFFSELSGFKGFFSISFYTNVCESMDFDLLKEVIFNTFMLQYSEKPKFTNPYYNNSSDFKVTEWIRKHQ